jgi:hypothetical protein
MDTDTRGIVTRYYDPANAGDWGTWCDLFATGTGMDEQSSWPATSRAGTHCVS